MSEPEVVDVSRVFDYVDTLRADMVDMSAVMREGYKDYVKEMLAIVDVNNAKMDRYTEQTEATFKRIDEHAAERHKEWACTVMKSTRLNAAAILAAAPDSYNTSVYQIARKVKELEDALSETFNV